MKRRIYALFLLILAICLCACGNEEKAPQPEPSQTENAEPVYYEGHGIKMEIPAIWQDTFVSYYKEMGEGESAYTLLEFMTRVREDETGVMTIASFTEESWQQALKLVPDAEDMKIGTSKDGKTHYTIRFDETKFDKKADQEKFDAIVAAAKEYSKTIEIIE